MSEFNKFVGLDVHKSTIAISIAPEDGGEVRYFGEIKNTKEALTNFANKISQGSLSYPSVTRLVAVDMRSIGTCAILAMIAWLWFHP